MAVQPGNGVIPRRRVVGIDDDHLVRAVRDVDDDKVRILLHRSVFEHEENAFSRPVTADAHGDGPLSFEVERSPIFEEDLLLVAAPGSNPHGMRVIRDDDGDEDEQIRYQLPEAFHVRSSG